MPGLPENEVEKRLHYLEKEIGETRVVYAEVKNDLKHLTKEVGNGLSQAIIDIRDILAEIVPLVRRNAEWREKANGENLMGSVKSSAYWVGKFKQAIFWIAILGVLGGLVKYLLTFK